jgi:hypothetical protein
MLQVSCPGGRGPIVCVEWGCQRSELLRSDASGRNEPGIGGSLHGGVCLSPFAALLYLKAKTSDKHENQRLTPGLPGISR